MKQFLLLLLVAVSCAMLLCSCVGLRSGAPVAANYAAASDAPFEEQPSMWRRFLNLIPPPSEARKNWDREQRRRYNQWSSEDVGGPQFP
jgi:hypothetical protein